MPVDEHDRSSLTPSTPPTDDEHAPQPPTAAEPERRSSLAWGLALVAAGTLWLLSQLGVAIPWELVLPGALVAIGALLLLGGRWGAHGGWIALGIVLTVLALLGPVAPAPTVAAGDRTHVVTELGDLEPTYALGAGTLTVDLADLELPAGTTEVSASVTVGEVIVRVPPEATVDGEASAGMGEVVGFGRDSSGIAPQLSLSDTGDDPDRALQLDVRAGLGSVEVTR